MTIQFTRAARHAVKLKIGIDGPSGSGKTLGALALAHGITKGGRIAVADSENGSASLYADRYEFDTVPVATADPAFLHEIITVAVGAKYDALVIDSLTHAWQFVLNLKDDHDRANPKSNSWTNWRKFAPLWEDLMQDILQAPIHIIATMRSKQAYEQVENNGRKQVVKLGLQPQVRDGAEYEFGLVFSVNQAHKAEATKDRTALFADQIVDLCDPEVHASLVGWMNAGGPALGEHTSVPRFRSDPVAATPAASGVKVMPFGKTKGKPLGEHTTEDLERTVKWCREKDADKFKDLIASCTAILNDRALGVPPAYDETGFPTALRDEADALPF